MWQEGEESKETDPLPHGMWFKTNWTQKNNPCNLLTGEQALQGAFDKQSRTYTGIWIFNS